MDALESKTLHAFAAFHLDKATKFDTDIIIIISLYHSCTQTELQTGTNQTRIGSVNHPVSGAGKKWEKLVLSNREI